MITNPNKLKQTQKNMKNPTNTVKLRQMQHPALVGCL